jgi:RNA polymerase sigma factor (sigma-70 family)
MAGGRNRAARVRRAVQRHERHLVAYATGLVRDRERARDFVQESFLRLCREPEELPDERVAPWLFKVCRNLCLDELRKAGRMTTLDTPSAQLESPGPRETEDLDAALALIERLPVNQRECIQLKFLHELTYREIAEVTSLSVSNVGYLIHVGLKAVRQGLTEEPVTLQKGVAR